MTGVQRGQIWWADLPGPPGSGPVYRRPVLVIQAGAFNRSRIRTVIVAVITSNLGRADAPGNVQLPGKSSKLRKDSVVNVSQIYTLDRESLIQRVSSLSTQLLSAVDAGLRLVLEL